MREKRRAKRFAAVELAGHLLGVAEVRVLDISLTGVAVEATGPGLRVNRRCTVAFTDPATGAIRLQGTVVWCDLHEIRRSPAGEVVPVFRAGIDFEPGDPGLRQQVVDLIERKASVRLERWIQGTFTIREHEGVSVFLQYLFRLHEINRRSMTVEVDMVPEVGSEFEMDLALDGGPCRVTGRIAEVRRVRRAVGGETSLLKVELLDLGGDTLRFVEEFIADEVDTTLGIS
jgi:hypothetical protein